MYEISDHMNLRRSIHSCHIWLVLLSINISVFKTFSFNHMNIHASLSCFIHLIYKYSTFQDWLFQWPRHSSLATMFHLSYLSILQFSTALISILMFILSIFILASGSFSMCVSALAYTYLSILLPNNFFNMLYNWYILEK